MEAVTGVESPKTTHKVVIDYAQLADLYNAAVVGDGVQFEKVSNITVFRCRLAKRGVTSGTDFEVFTKDGKTIVKRLSKAQMLRR